MARSAINLWLAAGLVCALSAPAVPAWAADGDSCMDNRAVQALIASHRIKTWPAIKAMAGVSDQYKEVSAVRVCELSGTPYYVVNVAGPTGESRQLVLNAVTGSN
ncbi:MAG TPA: hypothetical protein VHB74_14695 [Devosia sp.]|nr:hypothetical protein [Devosia sp.]